MTVKDFMESIAVDNKDITIYLIDCESENGVTSQKIWTWEPWLESTWGDFPEIVLYSEMFMFTVDTHGNVFIMTNKMSDFLLYQCSETPKCALMDTERWT